VISSKKDRLVITANWALVVLAAAWGGYVWTGMFSLPPSSQVAVVQISPKDQASPTPATPQPTATIRSTTPEMPPPAAAIATGSASRPGAAQPGQPNRPSVSPQMIGNAPYAVAPAVPIPPLNPALLPPGVGKDF
jgi:hypothetical protein